MTRPSSSRKASPRIYRIGKLRCVWAILCTPRRQHSFPLLHQSHKGFLLTCVSLVTIQIQLIRTHGRLYALMPLNRIHQLAPAAARLGLRPPAIRLQDAVEADDPRCELDVDVGDVTAEEEGPDGVGCVD